MSESFTPGPWRLLPPSVGVDANWHVTDAGDTFVAHVFGFAHGVTEQSRINAALIASAPELFEALSSIKWGSSDKDNMEFFAQITCWQMDKIRAALLKASPEQSDV